MRVITAVNQKGGAGKTTSAVNMAAAAAEVGRRTLLIDLDPQASSTRWLSGQGEVSSEDADMSDVFAGEVKLHEICRASTAPGVDLAPSSLRLATAERNREPGAELAVKLALETAGVDYDIVFIDSPPTLGLLAIAGLTAATEVLIPVAQGAMDLDGVAQLLQTIERVTERLRPDLRIGAVLRTGVKARTALSRDVEASLRKRFGDLLLDVGIRESVRMGEAPASHLPITLYDPAGKATEDYRAATTQLLQRGAAA